MDDDEASDHDDASANRLAVGIALGIPFGVALSLVLDNWAFVGVGVAFGVAFGAIPAGGAQDDEDDPEPPRDA